VESLNLKRNIKHNSPLHKYFEVVFTWFANSIFLRAASMQILQIICRKIEKWLGFIQGT